MSDTNIRSLDEIGLAFGTDKSSAHHDYLSFYESHFRELRKKRITILEIGVLGGASLETWREYFPNAEIIGVDVSPYARSLVGRQIKIEIADQSNLEEMCGLGVRHGPFDIIIEDGSHMWEHQILSLKLLFPFLSSDGIYIIEDLQTNYGVEAGHYSANSAISCVEYLKKLLDAMVAEHMFDLAKEPDPFLRTYGRAIKFISFYKGCCLLKKNYVDIVRSNGIVLPGRKSEVTYLEVDILAHVSDVGDVRSSRGYIDAGSGDAPLQGISVDVAQGEILQYKVRFDNGAWGEWTAQNNFAGTRGQGRPLTGLKFRVLPKFQKYYGLEVIGLFKNVSSPISAGNDQDCVAGLNDALYAFQLNIIAGSSSS